MLHWSRPEFLLLLAALPWFWWSAARANRRVSRSAILWRSTIAALLVLAAAGPGLAMRDGRMTVIYSADRSDSLTPRDQENALTRINGWTPTMRAGDKAGVVVFGVAPVLERAPVERLRLPDVTSSVSGSGTDIAAALAAARAALPREGARRIVLFSDGRQTTGDVERETAIAAADAVPIDVVLPAGNSSRAPVVAMRVAAPTDVRANEPFLLSVEFAGRPGGRGQLVVSRDGQRFASREVVVPAEGTGSVSFSDEHRQSGMHGYQATVRDELEEDAADDSAVSTGPGTMVSVEGPPTVLYVAELPRTLAAVLGRSGFRVTEVTPGTVPSSTGALSQYDAIVLDDVPAERLETRQLSAIAGFVEQSGGGLLLLGSARSLDAGGYPTGPVGPLLPVDLRPRTGRRAPSMAFVLVFDKSGSMADLADGVPKIELARQAVMKVLDVVPPSDPLGIIAFDAAAVTVAPLSASRSAASIEARLRELKPGGSTAIAPAVEIATGWLRASSQVARRHILLLSDGRNSPADAERLRNAVRNQNIQLSVVAIGADADKAMLEQLAQSTGGRAFFPRDLRQLPQIVAREAARAAGGVVVEEPFTVRVASHPILSGIDTSALPRLGGYVVSAGKPGSETILASHLDDPVFCAGRAGLGKVAVFTGDLGSSWSAHLRSWDGAPMLWTQSVRWLSRRINDRGLSAIVKEVVDGARLTVEAWQPGGTFASELDVQAEVRTPAGDRQSLALEAVAPGRYEAAVPVSATGPYVMAITAKEPDGVERRVLRGLYWSADREHRARGTDTRALARIAQVTGGRVLGGGDSPFSGPRPADVVGVGPWLSAAALLLFFGELAGGAIRNSRPGGWRVRRRRQRTGDGAKAA